MGTVDTTDLRARSKIIDTDLPLTAQAMTDAADEIDALRTALDAVPHGTLCGFMMSLHQEPCSCPKSILTGTVPPATDPLTLVNDATTVTYLAATRLDVYGPAGRVVGVLGVTGVHVEQHDNGRRLVVVFEHNA